MEKITHTRLGGISIGILFVLISYFFESKLPNFEEKYYWLFVILYIANLGSLYIGIEEVSAIIADSNKKIFWQIIFIIMFALVICQCCIFATTLRIGTDPRLDGLTFADLFFNESSVFMMQIVLFFFIFTRTLFYGPEVVKIKKKIQQDKLDYFR
jgi:hypothetical protein